MLIPRFRAEESWDGSGDVDIWFQDNTSQDLRNRVCNELNEMIPRLHKYERSIYHVECLVDRIFLDMRKTNNLRINTRIKQWIWGEEAGHDKGRYYNDNLFQKCR